MIGFSLSKMAGSKNIFFVLVIYEGVTLSGIFCWKNFIKLPECLNRLTGHITSHFRGFKVNSKSHLDHDHFQQGNNHFERQDLMVLTTRSPKWHNNRVKNIYPHKSQLGKNFSLKEEIISAILFAKVQWFWCLRFYTNKIWI